MPFNMKIRDTLLFMLIYIEQTSIIKAKYYFTLFLLVRIHPSLASATDYYVSPSGNDINSGSLNSPLRTIRKGVTKLKAGDILYVRTGTYVEKVDVSVSGTSGSHITISAYPGEHPVIDGGTTLPVGDFSSLVRVYGNYINFSGFEIKNVNITGTYRSGYGVVATGLNCTLSYLTVHDAWGGGILIEGDYSIVEYCTVYDAALSNSKNPGTDGWGTGISACRDQVDGITDFAILRHNISHDNWGEGISCFESRGTIMEDNISYDNWSYNFYVSDTQDALIQRNLVYQTKAMAGAIYGSAGIVLTDELHIPASQNNTVINNLVYGCSRNFVTGIYKDFLIANNTFVNATTYSCVDFWNDTDGGGDFTFVNNISIQEGAVTIATINGGGSLDASVIRNHNLWSKTPVSGVSGAGDIIGDPLLSKPGSTEAGKLIAGYFKLLNNSPAINKGTYISKVTNDFFGNPRDAAPDIGAHEYTILNQKIQVTGITVTGAGGANTITADHGALQLSAAISPSNATNKTVTWSMANGTGQATISSAGIVTAVTNGTVTARATATDGSGVYGTFLITISNQVILVAGILVAGAGGANTITSDKGTLQLTAITSPSNATNQTVTWSIANGTGQATINSAGIVTAVSNGTVTARAEATDGSGVYGTFPIAISNQVIPVAPAIPVYISSAIENATPSRLEMTYSLTLASSVPAVSAFAVKINSSAISVTAVTVSGTKVILTLASPVIYGNVVTVAYTKPAVNPIKTAAGGEAVSIGAQPVTNRLNYVNSPPVVVVNYTPASLSGFVGEINASNSYDPNNDKLSYEWIAPDNVPISSSNNPTVKFLSPVVSKPTTYDFIVKISDGKITQSKTLPVEVFPYKPELEEAKILKIEASSFQSPNFPYNILDGNIGTMWAADGTEQWLLLHLKEPFKVDHVKLAFQSGMKSESYFDILGSADNLTWEPVLTKSASCGFSGNPQVFGFPATKAEQEYSFIKLVGQCNSVNTWNYISELKLFGFGQKTLTFKEQSQIIIYPNPANDYINISIKVQTLTPDFIRIINLSGKIVYEEMVEPDNKELQIPINLFNGVYIVQMGSGDLTLFTQKLIVSK